MPIPSGKYFLRLLLQALLAFAFLAAPVHAASLRPGERAPLFTVKALNGTEIALKDRVGPGRKNGVILVFFTTWCPSCREELPLIDALAGEFKARNIDVILIGYQEGPEKLEAFLRRIGVKNLVAAADVSGETGERYNLRMLPALFVIAADGTVKDSLIGESPDVQWYLRKAAEGLSGK